jgi:protein-S-isoprenylcysteine O-methyltransferase Ste14
VIALKNSEFVERTFGDAVGDQWESISVAISFLGLFIRCLTVGYVPRGTSGRNTRSQVAEKLNISGMYSITRNPLYLGNFIIVFGITLFIQVWWLAVIVWLGFWFYYERIIFAEEEFLRRKFGDQFISWAQKTPVLFPRFSNWKQPDLPFSLKSVLRREFSTYFAIVAVYFFLEIGGTLLVENRFSIHSSWVIFFFVSMAVYFSLLILKKKTHRLDVPGR